MTAAKHAGYVASERIWEERVAGGGLGGVVSRDATPTFRTPARLDVTAVGALEV